MSGLRQALARRALPSVYGPAIVAGRRSFLGHSPRNTGAAYDEIYVRAAFEYACAVGRPELAQREVLTCILAFPTLEQADLKNLSANVAKQGGPLMAEIDTLNLRHPLFGGLLEKVVISQNARDALFFLGMAAYSRVEWSEVDVPHMHRRIMESARLDGPAPCFSGKSALSQVFGDTTRARAQVTRMRRQMLARVAGQIPLPAPGLA